jgi:hypothetical protein
MNWFLAVLPQAKLTRYSEEVGLSLHAYTSSWKVGPWTPGTDPNNYANMPHATAIVNFATSGPIDYIHLED